MFSDRMVFVRAVHNAKWMSELELQVYDSWFNPIVSALPTVRAAGKHSTASHFSAQMFLSRSWCCGLRLQTHWPATADSLTPSCLHRNAWGRRGASAACTLCQWCSVFTTVVLKNCSSFL